MKPSKKKAKAEKITPENATISAEAADPFTGRDDGFMGFKFIDSVPLPAEDTLETMEEFCTVDASDLIKDKEKKISRKDWVDLLNQSFDDKMILLADSTRKRLLKTIIKSGVPADL